MNAALAVWLTRNWTAEQILTEQAKRSYYGNEMFGIGNAADFYFGKKVPDLTLEEVALLVSLSLEEPTRLDPLKDREAAKQRRNGLLNKMGEKSFITDAVTELATRTPIALSGENANQGFDEQTSLIEYLEESVAACKKYCLVGVDRDKCPSDEYFVDKCPVRSVLTVGFGDYRVTTDGQNPDICKGLQRLH